MRQSNGDGEEVAVVGAGYRDRARGLAQMAVRRGDRRMDV